jgi:hypothetical protein
MSAAPPHSDNGHFHGSDCGHTAIKHKGHVDYLHEGHLHHSVDTAGSRLVEEHILEVSTENPSAARPNIIAVDTCPATSTVRLWT